jgi:GDP-L-fucose synthase
MYLLNKHALVTGSAGLVGGALLPALEACGCDVTAAYRYKRPNHEKLINVDLTRREDCDNATRDIDIVFHCAANTSGAAAMSNDPLQHVTPNIIMNAQLLEAAYRNGVKKFVWLASTTGYPELDRPAKEEDMWVGQPWDKYFYVGWTKRMTEKLCEMYTRLGMLCIVLRPTNIYGPGDKFDPAKSHVLPALIRKVVERQIPIECWGDGLDERDLIFVDDMVEAICKSAELITSFKPINIGCGRTVSVNYILKTIMRIEDFNAPIKYLKDKPTMISKRSVDISLAKELLDFEAKTSLQDGLRKTIEWFKNARITSST